MGNIAAKLGIWCPIQQISKGRLRKLNWLNPSRISLLCGDTWSWFKSLAVLCTMPTSPPQSTVWWHRWCCHSLDRTHRFLRHPLPGVGVVPPSSQVTATLCFPDSIKNAGGRVFVHCQAGISRSATICLAYLMRTNRVKLDEAFEFVKQRRSIISPNFSFMGQLLQFESQVLAPHCSAEAGSPAMAVLDRGTSTTTVFNFPVSIPVHSTNSALSYLQSPITTSPSCWKATGGDLCDPLGL